MPFGIDRELRGVERIRARSPDDRLMDDRYRSRTSSRPGRSEIAVALRKLSVPTTLAFLLIAGLPKVAFAIDSFCTGGAQGGPSGDTYNGGSGDNIYAGLGGGDSIDGNGGDDRLCGDNGSDTISGGSQGRCDGW